MKIRDIIKVWRWRSPIGDLILGTVNDNVCLCDWDTRHDRDVIDGRICRLLQCEREEGSSRVTDALVEELSEYFSGKRREFDLPLQFVGTDFQCRVWSELMRIPYGSVATYADVACRIGKPRAVRAVAAAIGANPMSILVPCHRVIGSDGRLTGYAGGLAAKQALLSLENAKGSGAITMDRQADTDLFTYL